MSEQSFDPARFKAEERKAWGANAAGWTRWWETLDRAGRPVAERLVELANIGPGHRVLDIATGIGEPAATAARKVGPNGRVVATDTAPEMLAFGRERAARLGLDNIEFREADAESLAIDEDGFDAVLCRWGLMFLPNLEAALKRVYQLLKGGGWFATAVWGPASEVPISWRAAGAIRLLAQLPSPPPGTPDPFRLADTKILERALEAEGFHDLRVEHLQVTFEFQSADAFVDFRVDLWQALRETLVSKPRELGDKIRTAIRDAARPYAAADGSVRIANHGICVAAQK